MTDRMIHLLQTHKITAVLLVVVVTFTWLFTVVNQTTQTVATPTGGQTDTIETQIGPVNTKSFEALKDRLNLQATLPRSNWSGVRDPFTVPVP